MEKRARLWSEGKLGDEFFIVLEGELKKLTLGDLLFKYERLKGKPLQISLSRSDDEVREFLIKGIIDVFKRNER